MTTATVIDLANIRSAKAAQQSLVPEYLAKIADQYRPMAGEVGLLYGTDLVRLHGVADDRMDCYFIVEAPQHGMFWAAISSNWDRLRDNISPEAYARVEQPFIEAGVVARKFMIQLTRGFEIMTIEGRDFTKPPLADEYHKAYLEELDMIDPDYDDQKRRADLAFEIQQMREGALASDPELARQIEILAGAQLGPDRRATGSLTDYLERLRLEERKQERRDLVTTGEVLSAVAVAAAQAAGANPALAMMLKESCDIQKAKADAACDAQLAEEMTEDLRSFHYDVFDDPELEDMDHDPSESDEIIIAAMAKQLPHLPAFLGYWLRKNPALTRLWRDRANEGKGVPLTAFMTAFCLAELPHVRKDPSIIMLTEAEAAEILADLERCKVSITD
ncbi:hypothetical protein ACEUZ9_001060 [Paracoccus litorisediminis]|uniref:hypothetical protein n=1 Tax=Paracoccus litorisediminis TaxID=2006130 RepID=UPI0037340693